MSSNNPQGQNQHTDNNDSQRKNQGSWQAEQSNDPSGNRQQGQNDPSGSSGNQGSREQHGDFFPPHTPEPALIRRAAPCRETDARQAASQRWGVRLVTSGRAASTPEAARPYFLPLLRPSFSEPHHCSSFFFHSLSQHPLP